MGIDGRVRIDVNYICYEKSERLKTTIFCFLITADSLTGGSIDDMQVDIFHPWTLNRRKNRLCDMEDVERTTKVSIDRSID